MQHKYTIYFTLIISKNYIKGSVNVLNKLPNKKQIKQSMNVIYAFTLIRVKKYI